MLDDPSIAPAVAPMLDDRSIATAVPPMLDAQCTADAAMLDREHRQGTEESTTGIHNSMLRSMASDEQPSESPIFPSQIDVSDGEEALGETREKVLPLASRGDVLKRSKKFFEGDKDLELFCFEQELETVKEENVKLKLTTKSQQDSIAVLSQKIHQLESSKSQGSQGERWFGENEQFTYVTKRGVEGIANQKSLQCQSFDGSKGKGESAQSTLAWVFLKCQNSVLAQRPLHVLSYDVSKCFDSLPWDAVRDSLFACGVHRATAQALHNHWHSLRRIWKLQGRYHDATFDASNGLFQGDPTAPAGLAAFLVEPMLHIGQAWPMVRASQYADDILLVSEDASSLAAANKYLEGWMRKHRVQFNVGKCHYFCTDTQAATSDFQVGGKTLECASLLENLGDRFQLDSEGLPVADEQHQTGVYERFTEVAQRLGRLSVGWDVRSADVKAIMPMLTYSALLWNPADFSDARKQRLMVNVLSGGKENTRRCVEVSLAVLSPVHRTRIPAALLHEQMLVLGRLINVNADFRQEVQKHFRLCSAMEVAPSGSFYASFRASLQEYGWDWLKWHTIRSRDGVEHLLAGVTLEARRAQVCADLRRATQADDLKRLVEEMAQSHRSMCHWSLLLHSLREDMRQYMCANAARRRRDMKGLQEVDRETLRALWKKVPENDHPTLRFLMQGAAMTADREHRGTKGRVSSICSHCAMGVVEDETHRYWQCPCWTEIRHEHLGDASDELCASLSQLPSAASVCALPVKQLSSGVRVMWPEICSCMIAIHRRATAAHASSG
ncbi:unnamed protein product [Symbiodinium sp. CCMP2592]|nr:unnamed protein product [Symbiodinium sp. CCMP2592]